MSKRIAPRAPGQRALQTYQAFDQIDGRHPWQDAVPEGFVPYQVRMLGRGKVVYFNYGLAREMGLIPANHPNTLTPELTDKIIETFSLQIVNEYDQQNGTRFAKDSLKPHPYMATRYLQLQHADKRGRTSGDGRSVWNGVFENNGVVWDVSSRGTGVTCLAPGAVEAERPLKTGAAEFGYGCGLADVSELLGSAILSEIFHSNGVNTERVLTVIDLGKGCGIGVRAAPNLLRPAHLFLFLKQERLEPLRRATDYFIERQVKNGSWKIAKNSPDRYRRMLEEVTLGFAKFTANLEREYIFLWMDWDGDNLLADAGIIDYGSIRRFGLRHDQYRYDDVQRFSTNLNEQRGKARLTVQVFAQMVSYLETGRRRAIEDFENHQAVRDFDREFDRCVRMEFLAQVGLDESQAEKLMKNNGTEVEALYSSFLALEKIKTQAGVKKLPDGVNRPAVFNLRAALREMPRLHLNSPVISWDKTLPLPTEEFLELIATSFTKRADRKLKGALRRRIDEFQTSYIKVLRLALGERNRTLQLRNLAIRAEDRNRAGRITGNGAEFVIDELLKARRKGVSTEAIQAAVELFIANQSPRAPRSPRTVQQGRQLQRKGQLTSLQSDAGRLFQELVHIAFEFQEDI